MENKFVIGEIREEYAKLVKLPQLEGIEEQGGCVVYAWATLNVLARRGIRGVVQAGSLSWPMIDMSEDDGVSATHFSYVWSPNDMGSQVNTVLGGIPELHAWVGIPSTNEIVDLTTGFLPKQAKKLCGFDWTGPLPPDYLWVNVRDVPEDVYYDANKQACAFVHSVLTVLAKAARTELAGKSARQPDKYPQDLTRN